MKNKNKAITAFIAVVAICLGTNNAFAQSCTGACNADAGPDQTICCGTATLGGTGAGNCRGATSNCNFDGNPGTTYSWSPTTGLSSSTVCHPTANPGWGNTITYTLTVTFNCGNSSTGLATCCCDGCSGPTDCKIATPCSSSKTVTDACVITKVPLNQSCCRLMNPAQQNEVVSENIYLYPNPSTGEFKLSLFKSEHPSDVHVYNVNGDAVWGRQNIDSSQIHMPIDLSGEAKGIYFVRVTRNDNVIFFKKVIVQ